MSDGMTCYERDEILCEDAMCLRTGCSLRNQRLEKESKRDWQPIESAPKDEAVWVYCDDGMRHVAVKRSNWDWKLLRNRELWELLWPEFDKLKRVTHWQPLPHPPVQSCPEK